MRVPHAAASALSSRAKCWRVRCPLSPKDGNSHFDCSSRAALPRKLEIVGHRALGGVVERHQALLAALAAHDQHALRRACGAAAGSATSSRRAARWRRAVPAGTAGARRAAARRGDCSASSLPRARRSSSRSTSSIESTSAAARRASGLRARRPDRRRAGLRRRGSDGAGASPKAGAPPTMP